MINDFKLLTNLKKIASWCLCGITCAAVFTSSACAMDVREVRILAIEGEGVRAIIPLTVLQSIEEHLQNMIHLTDYFDSIAGTDSGAHLIAEGLNAKKTTKELMNQYRNGQILATSTNPSMEQADNIIDATCLTLKLMEEKYPRSNLFIVTLGAGSTPNTNFNSPQHLKRNSLFESLRKIKEQGRTVEHISIDISIPNEIANPNIAENSQNLRQAGLSLCNSQNPYGASQNIQKIVKKLREHTNPKK